MPSRAFLRSTRSSLAAHRPERSPYSRVVGRQLGRLSAFQAAVTVRGLSSMSAVCYFIATQLHAANIENQGRFAGDARSVPACGPGALEVRCAGRPWGAGVLGSGPERAGAAVEALPRVR